MTVEKFSRNFDVATSRDEVWAVVTSVSEVVSWVSILSNVEEQEHLVAYTAILQDSVGPLQMMAKLTVDVIDVEQGRRVRFRARGRDRQVNSRIDIDASLTLKALASGTSLTVDGTYKVTGRVASMGGGIIRKKATQILDEFTENAQGALMPAKTR